MPRSLEYLSAAGVTSINFAKDWGTVGPSATSSEKRWVRNNGDLDQANLVLQLSDPLLNGGIGIWKHALDTVSVRPPYGGAAVEGNGSPVGGHVLVNDEAWGFSVTRVNAVGETQGSVEFFYTIADDTADVDLSWIVPGGPAGTSIQVWARQSAGTYLRIATGLGAAATTFTWDGAAPSGGTFPVANTTASVTGPNYGTAPSLVTTDLSVGALAVGEARAFWKGYVIGSSPGDATYTVATHPVET